MLEQAVGIDPSYAPAWEALGRRYYISSEYGAHGDPMRQRSEFALERAIVPGHAHVRGGACQFNLHSGPAVGDSRWCGLLREYGNRVDQWVFGGVPAGAWLIPGAAGCAVDHACWPGWGVFARAVWSETRQDSPARPTFADHADTRGIVRSSWRRWAPGIPQPADSAGNLYAHDLGDFRRLDPQPHADLDRPVRFRVLNMKIRTS
jgi:hypothetical protein